MRFLIEVGNYLSKFCGMLMVLLLPIKSAAIAIAVLILADFLSGVWASAYEKKPITSNGFRRTLVKVLMYEMSILVAFILEKYLFDDVPVVKALTALLGLIEGKSFFENMYRITGVDIWGLLVSKLNLQDVKNSDSENK